MTLAWLRRNWYLVGFGYMVLTAILAGALLIEGPINSLGQLTALCKFLLVWTLFGFPVGILFRRWGDRPPNWEEWVKSEVVK